MFLSFTNRDKLILSIKLIIAKKQDSPFFVYFLISFVLLIMRKLYSFFLTSVILITTVIDASAQMKIGANPTAINDNAILELEAPNKGLRLPRVQLVLETSSAPLTAHVEGIMVYNIDSAGVGIDRVFPGIYYNNGTRWVRTSSQAVSNPITGQLVTDRKLVTIATNGQTVLNFPSGLPAINSDENFFLYRNGVLLIKDIDYRIANTNQIWIINSSFSLATTDELYAVIKSIR